MISAVNTASPGKTKGACVVAKLSLPPHCALTERMQTALLSADIVDIEINALEYSIREFSPAALAFLLNNADRIFGIVDCCHKDLSYWEKLLYETTFSQQDGCRWTVRLLASEPAGWEDRIALHGPKGVFELTADKAVA